MPRIFTWPKGRAPLGRRNRTTGIAIHCSATPEGKAFDATDIDHMHIQRGFSGIGYHYVVHLDGSVEQGRPDWAVGAHIEGHNSELVGVCYIGGLDEHGKAKDTRTPEQKDALKLLLRSLIAKYRPSKVGGHRDWSPDKNHDGKITPNEWLKDCPCFDVAEWMKAEKLLLLARTA